MPVKPTTMGRFRNCGLFDSADCQNVRLSRKDAAKHLGFAPATLANWALRGYGPPSFKVGGRRFYWLADLERFVTAEGGIE